MGRETLGGTPLTTLDNAQDFTLKTKAPAKWVVVDIESGAVYTPDPENPRFDFSKANRQQLVEAQIAIETMLRKL